MATPYEKGRQQTANTLDNWKEGGWSSMQEMAEQMGADMLEELAHAQEEASRDDLSERSHQVWENHVEFFKGMLSRLD